jgi:hypothetical protein
VLASASTAGTGREWYALANIGAGIDVICLRISVLKLITASKGIAPMTLNWNEFSAGVNEKRFLLPVRNFHFDVQYVRVSPSIDEMQMAANFVSACALNTLKGSPDCELSALKLVPGVEPGKEVQDEESTPSYFNVLYPHPVYDFTLQIGAEAIRISKVRSSLEDLIATIPILEDLCQRLFGGKTPPGGPPPAEAPSILKLMRLGGRIHRVAFSFEQRLRVTTHKIQTNVQATNVELLHKLMRTSHSPGVHLPDHQAPLVGLQPEGIMRGDVTLSLIKTLASRPRNLWIDYKAWYNINRKDLDLEFQYRCGGTSSPWQESDLLDWRTPFTEFYRDLILNQTCPK